MQIDISQQVNNDSTANQYLLKCMNYVMAAFTFVWVLDATNIFIVEHNIVFTGFFVALALFIVMNMLSKKLDMASRSTKYVLMSFIVLMLTVVGVTLTYHVVIVFALPVLYSTMYSSKKFTLVTYLESVACIFISTVGGYFWGLCDANMVLLTTARLQSYIGADGTFMLNAVNTNPLFTVTLYYFVPRALVIGALLPTCNSINRIITDNTRRAKELEIRSERDPLTGVYTRSTGEKYIKRLMSAGRSGTFCMIDIDNFKYINDEYGHFTGDAVLVALSECLMSCFRDRDIVMRFGGDEFAVFLTDLSDVTLLDHVFDRLYKDIDNITIEILKDVKLSVSVGAEIYTAGSDMSYQTLFEHSDKALYDSKHMGKRTYTMYTE